MLQQSKVVINFKRLLKSTQQHVEQLSINKNAKAKGGSKAQPCNVTLTKYIETLNKYHTILQNESKKGYISQLACLIVSCLTPSM